MQMQLKGQYVTVWRLIKAYWQSEKKLFAYLNLVFILLMTIMLVGFDVIFNYWYNYFYNALQAYNKAESVRLLIVFFALATLYIILAVYRFYIAQLFALRWRKWLTDQVVNRWLSNRSYYYLENFDERTDNPDQRIQEDCGSLVTYTIDLTMGFVSAITTFFAFIYVLWTLSGVLVLPLGTLGSIAIPGYLVWVSVMYAGAGTYLTYIIGRPLIGLNFEQQRREATFRFAAVDLRQHSEHVALYRGEKHEKTILERVFGRVLDNWYMIILRQKLLLWFTAGYGQASVVLPLVVALPNYFNRVFMLGGLMQTLSAFRNVQDSLSFVVNSFNTIAQWQAVAQRLTTFLNHMQETDAKAEENNKVQYSEGGQKIIAKDLTIKTPHGLLLLKNVNETFEYGKRYLIKGASGVGKSTFVRTLAGIWPFASGEIVYPKDQRIMYLPQKNYMPIGTLAEAILFPDKQHKAMESRLVDILRECHLEYLEPRLYQTAAWSEQLSPGEQQRIAFARVLLHKPDWVILDETTSMLDMANETYFYQLLRTKLPGTSIISVGHRPSLQEYHDTVIDMGEFAPGNA